MRRAQRSAFSIVHTSRRTPSQRELSKPQALTEGVFITHLQYTPPRMVILPIFLYQILADAAGENALFP